MITLREPALDDISEFLQAMQASKDLHHPWTQAPLTKDEFQKYYERCQQDNFKSYLVCVEGKIAGVFNISEIVRGCFQNAYLGFYAVEMYAGRGYMSNGLKLVLKKVFNELGLHRIEANIQPDNVKSISLVSKNGFRKEGFSPRYLKINGQWCDHERWAITSEDVLNPASPQA